MISTTNALLVCVVFLCGLEETVLSQHGHCAGNQCLALFQEPENFPGALKSCKDSHGQLFKSSLKDIETILTILPSGLSGSYWLELQGTDTMTEEGAGDLQNCSYVSVSFEGNLTVLWGSCRKNLNGFLCQYTFSEPCGSLRIGGGTQVKYTTEHYDFEVRDSDTFPPGTFAVVKKVGGKYPDSKHVCFSGSWLAAPWTCEVLKGGCEHSCDSVTHACICPAGHTLQPNKFSCATDPCATCAHECQRQGDKYACKCRKGYRLAQDGKSCVDVNECVEKDPCTGENEECENTQGGYKCTCKDGFEAENGECVDISICEKCEHMTCDKVRGVYQCLCRKGYKVAAHDPTKCEMHCTERDCPARCIPNPDNKKEDMRQCFCPYGYILDIINDTAICRDINECELEKQCDHRCENLFGSYKCSCKDGFKLHKEYKCVPIEEDEDGSGSTSPQPTAASTHPDAVPSYIKTGSVLGIAVFMMLSAAVVFYLAHSVVKRCGSFELSSIKHRNIDIFYLQQVTTETYKRLSVDKQIKNDPQIL